MFEIYVGIGDERGLQSEFFISALISLLAVIGSVIANIIAICSIVSSERGRRKTFSASFDLDWFVDEFGRPLREASLEMRGLSDRFRELAHQADTSGLVFENFVDEHFVPVTEDLKEVMRSGVIGKYISPTDFDAVCIAQGNEIDSLYDVITDAYGGEEEWQKCCASFDYHTSNLMSRIRALAQGARRQVISEADKTS